MVYVIKCFGNEKTSNFSIGVWSDHNCLN